MPRRAVVATTSGPSTRPLGEALEASVPLASLLARIGESRALLARVRPLLPAGIDAYIRPGPLDDSGWSLLCANAAVAAKLRQLLPRLEQKLRTDGRAVAAVRIKVQPQDAELRTIPG